MSDWAAFGVFGSALGVIVLVGEALRAGAGWAPESSRRFVHAGAGLLVAVGVPFFMEPTLVYVLAALFVVANLVAIRRRLLPGMHAISRRSVGTVTFPLALIAALYLCWTLDSGRVYIVQAAFLVLALADPLASLVGMSLARPGRYRVGRHEKSAAGTAAFFGLALVLVSGFLWGWGPAALGPGAVLAGALAAAGCATAAEALGDGGWDNLLIVLAVVLPLCALDARPEAAALFAAAVAVAALFGAASVRARFLDISGALAAGLLAFAVVALGGVAWAAPGFTFFFLSSLLSRVGRVRKASAEALAEKGGRRDAAQVVANGGIAGVLLAATVFAPHPALYWAFVASFAAAAADTWGTEVGTFFGWPTRSVFTGSLVAPGTSGGVSLPGTLGALAGATAVFLSALPFAGPFMGGFGIPAAALLVIGSGFAAALFDSVLGATVQGRYQASGGELTERPAEGLRALPLAKGWHWITNDRVNLACTGAGALVPLVALW